ncbi:MAG: DMT family transporter [Pseudomonadota bacterium]
MPLWISITIAAAFLQNARSALQRALKGRLSGSGPSFVRFGYGLPFALLYWAALHAAHEATPGLNGAWAGYGALAAVAQILATVALLASFSYGSFAVGTAYSKTEPLLAAVFGVVLLGDAVTPLAGLAIVIGIAGVALMTLTGAQNTAATGDPVRTAALGILAAALFGISAVGYRAASLSLPEGGFLIRAAVTLAAATAFQTVLMALWMMWREPGALAAVARAWRPGLAVGFCGAAASAGWFTAMTIEPAAHVRALAQIELLFTFAASILMFRERPSVREILGAVLVIAGVVLLLRATAF